MSICESCNNPKLFPCKLAGIGLKTNGIAFVRPFPERVASRTRSPFSGPEGAEFNTFIAKAQLDRASSYMTYLVKCRPEKKGKEDKINKKDIDQCSQHLRNELLTMKPKIIVAFGEQVLTYFFPKAKLSEKRGLMLYSEEFNCPVIATYDPASTVKTSKFDDIIIRDLKSVYNYSSGIKEEARENKYVYATEFKTVQQIYERMKSVDVVAFDIETHTNNFITGDIISIAFSWHDHTGVCIPLKIKDENSQVIIPEGTKNPITYVNKYRDAHPVPKDFWGDKQEAVWDIIKKIFALPNCHFGGHNSYYDMMFLMHNGVKVTNYTFDTIVMYHLLNEEAKKDLDTLSWLYTDSGGYKLDKDEYLTNSDSSYLNIPINVLMPYNTKDADTTYQLYVRFKAELEKQGLWRLFMMSIEMQKILMEASLEGVLVDRDYVIRMRDEYQTRIVNIALDIAPILKKHYGDDVILVCDKDEAKEKGKNYFNINSVKQLKDLFYVKLKLKPLEDDEYTTDKDTLTQFAKKHDIARLLVQYRKLSKLKSTYLDATLENMDGKCRLHPTYLIHGTETGRLSSKNPNIQNIPRDKEIKSMFTAPEGYYLCNFDMSQHELRVLAGLSGDKGMSDIYATDGGDLHTKTACDCFKLTPEQIKADKEKRVIAKRVNFGIAYAIGAKGLVDILKTDGVNITERQAEEYINAWMASYPTAFRFLKGCVNSFFINGELVTMFGRKRRLFKRYNDKSVMASLQRQVQNYIIQSTASDIVSSVLLKLYPLLKAEGVKIKFTVHDSIVAEVPKNKLDIVRKIVRDNTKIVLPQMHGVAVMMDAEVGYNWGDMVAMPLDGEFNFDKALEEKHTKKQEKK